MTGLIIGAYPVYGASAEDAAAIVAALASRDDVGGLELSYAATGTLVPQGCPPHWQHVLTSIGDTMTRMAADPSYGLASPDPEGRRAALAALAGVREEVARLDGAVAAVEVHSAPRRTGSADALAESLAEAAAWDWSGARLLVEHCDRWRDDQPLQKGFLDLDAELAVAKAAGVGMSVNWARSVIESRDAATGAEHVAAAAEAGVLGAVMFSSVADRESSFGDAWVDAHLPPAGTAGAGSASLLTEERVRETLAAAAPQSPPPLVGLKIGVGGVGEPVTVRIARLLEAVDLVSRSGSAG